MRCLILTCNEFLVYDNDVAGLFNLAKPNDKKAVHLKEHRKLSDDEIDEMLKKFENIEFDDRISKKDDDVLDSLVHFFPEAKHCVQGDPENENPKPKTSKSKRALKKEQRDRALRDVEKAGEVKKKEDARKKVVDEQEKLLEKSGKKPRTWKDILFDALKHGGSEQKEQKERDMAKLIKGWEFIKKNQKLLEQNKDLMKNLDLLAQQKELTPDSIALLNEVITRDKGWIKKIDFDPIKDPVLRIPLSKFQVDDFEHAKEQLTDILAEENFKNVKIGNIDKGKVDLTTDWNTAMKLIKTFDIKSRDISQPLK